MQRQLDRRRFKREKKDRASAGASENAEGHKSRKACGIGRRTSRTLVTVRKKCRCSIKRWRKARRFTRRASEPCRKSRATVEKRQQSWKIRSRPCKWAKREEVAVRRNPMGAALIQPQGSRSSHLEKHEQQVLSNLSSKSSSGSAELQTRKRLG